MEENTKRPLENEECSDSETKKIKVTHELTTPQSKLPGTIGFINLCDDVIMHIFKYLSHDDLANMSRVCSTLSRISDDWTLWKDVRFDKYDKSMEDVYINYLKESTTNMSIRGDDDPSYNTSISHKFIIQLETKCPELTVLSLTKQKIDASEINIKMLHRRLKSLKIKKTVVDNISDNVSYLCGINNSCPDLESVTLSYNDWFMPHCLYALAKLEKLTYLSLKGCKHFKECIPYASITAITGFKLLQTLDLRFTPVSDHELVCFQRLKQLKHILLESPANTDHESDRTISDIGMTGFCSNMLEFQLPYIQIMIDRHGGVNLRRIAEEDQDRVERNPCRLKIEKLCVRHYPKVTDTFLMCVSKTCPNLEQIDVTGTSCTLEGIERYKTKRPNVKLVY